MSAIHHSTSQGASEKRSPRYALSKANAFKILREISENPELFEEKPPKRAKISQGELFRGNVGPCFGESPEYNPWKDAPFKVNVVFDATWEPLRSKSVSSTTSGPLPSKADPASAWKSFRRNDFRSSEESMRKSLSKVENLRRKVVPNDAWAPLRIQSVPSTTANWEPSRSRSISSAASEPIAGKVGSSAARKAFKSTVNPSIGERPKGKPPKDEPLIGKLDPIVRQSLEDNLFKKMPKVHHSASRGPPKRSSRYNASKANAFKILREISETPELFQEKPLVIDEPEKRHLYRKVVSSPGESLKGNNPKALSLRGKVDPNVRQILHDNLFKGESFRRKFDTSDEHTREDNTPKDDSPTVNTVTREERSAKDNIAPNDGESAKGRDHAIIGDESAVKDNDPNDESSTGNAIPKDGQSPKDNTPKGECSVKTLTPNTDSALYKVGEVVPADELSIKDNSPQVENLTANAVTSDEEPVKDYDLTCESSTGKAISNDGESADNFTSSDEHTLIDVSTEGESLTDKVEPGDELSVKSGAPEGESLTSDVISNTGESVIHKSSLWDYPPHGEPLIADLLHNAEVSIRNSAPKDEIDCASRDFKSPGKQEGSSSDSIDNTKSAEQKPPSTRTDLWSCPVCKSSMEFTSCTSGGIFGPVSSVSKCTPSHEVLLADEKAIRQKVNSDSMKSSFQLARGRDTIRRFSLSYVSSKLKSGLALTRRRKDTKSSLYDIKSDERYISAESPNPKESYEINLEVHPRLDTAPGAHIPVELPVSEIGVMSAIENTVTEVAPATKLQKEALPSRMSPRHSKGSPATFSLKAGDTQAITGPFVRSISRTLTDYLICFNQKSASTIATPSFTSISARMTVDSGKLTSIFDEYPGDSYSGASSSTQIIRTSGRTYQRIDSAPSQFTRFKASRFVQSKRNGGASSMPSKLAIFEDDAPCSSIASPANSLGVFCDRNAKYSAPQSHLKRSERSDAGTKSEPHNSRFLAYYGTTPLFLCYNDTAIFVSSNPYATAPSHSSVGYVRAKYQYKCQLGAKAKFRVLGWKERLSSCLFNARVSLERRKEFMKWTHITLRNRCWSFEA